MYGTIIYLNIDRYQAEKNLAYLFMKSESDENTRLYSSLMELCGDKTENKSLLIYM